MTEFTTVLDLAKDVKKKINEYNETEPQAKKDAYSNLQLYVHDLMAIPKNRSLIYKGSTISVVFSRTLGQWRMKIWKELYEK